MVRRNKNSLLDDVASYKIRRGPQCRLCAIEDKELLATANQIMRERGVCHRAMRAALTKRGYDITVGTLSNHYHEGHHRAEAKSR